ncbi:MAG: Alkylhydroperoxidase AhpD core [Mycobacterium sp.]|jgi:AhpD family alkylhydroperoxidase|nr:Alkylhydroperoxidase AhpD core [Mycobacterium sp.]
MDTEHVLIDKASPQAYRAAVGVATAVTADANNNDLPRTLIELINVRVSQINGCATCLDVHVRKAAAAGVTSRQLATLSQWRETELFDEREQAALRLAEITTNLPDHDIAEQEYARARDVLTEGQMSAVIWVAIAINAFNRVSILSRHPVRPQRS